MAEYGRNQNGKALENLRNESYTTIGVHEIRSNSSASQHNNANNNNLESRLQAVESLKQLRLPKLASNFEISTNPSSVKKDKRS
jgi:hypothetical protein